MIQIKTLSLFQGNPQNNDFINSVTLQTQQFLCPITPSERDWRQRKQIINRETDTTAIMLYSLKKEAGHEREKDKCTN